MVPIGVNQVQPTKSDSEYRLCTVDDNVKAHKADTQHLKTV